MKRFLGFIAVLAFAVATHAADTGNEPCTINKPHQCPVGLNGQDGSDGQSGLDGANGRDGTVSDRQISLGLAASSHQYDVNHSGPQASVGIGYYGAQSAMSVGVGIKTGPAFMNMSATSDGKKAGFGIGASFKF